MTRNSTAAHPFGPPPRFARNWLIAAGIYNLIWGAVVVAVPNLFFELAGMEPMRYPSIWQCVGMIVGVYGIGYLIAAGDPRMHWPIVLVGLLGKVFGPIGFALALSDGVFPPGFAWTILTNDLIWWVPFVMILWDAARSRGQLPDEEPVSLDHALDTLRDQHGHTLRELTERQPTLVTLTRHSGCTFCKEMLAELAQKQPDARERGMAVAVVTMSGAEANARLGEQFDLGDAHWFSDPDRLAYRALELRRGSVWQLFGPSVFLRGLIATLKGHRVGQLDGDGFQMPGAFVLHEGRVVRSFRAPTAAAQPDFAGMICEVPG